MVPKARRWAIVALVVLLAGVPAHAQARIDSDTIDRVGSSVVRVSAWIKKTENGVTTDDYRTVGSGTLVRGDGVILTSYHVIDLDALKSALTAEEENARRNRVEISLTLQDRFAIWVPNSFGDTPAVSYTAEVVPEASDSQLDLAVVRIAAGPRGQPLGSHVVDLPAVRLGDSDRPLKGDPLHVFGYRVGKTSWEYVPGTVSDIETAADVDGRAWFDSNAPVASGFSGGAAVDDAGALVGVPTRLAADECASGSSDGGEPCLPTGGASLKLRPISLALPLLARVIPELVASLTPTRPAALQQTVEMVDINFKPKQLTILANTDVTINLVNEGALTHNFNIDQLNVHSGDYASDQTGTVTLNAAPGTYEYYCSIPGHKQAAMVGTLTVR